MNFMFVLYIVLFYFIPGKKCKDKKICTIEKLVSSYIFPFLFYEQKHLKRNATPETTTALPSTTAVTTVAHHGNKTTTVAVGPKKLPICDEDVLMVHLADIQAINPESIVNLATLDELTELCTKVSEKLDAIDNFLKGCEPAQEKSLYIQLIKGVDTLYQEICTDGKFKKSFEKHFHCIKDLHSEYEDCSGPADWTEDMSQENVCKAYQHIIDCFYIKTANVCGKEAAHIMRELSKTVVSNILTLNCGKMNNEPKLGPEIPDNIEDSPKTKHTGKNNESRITLNENFIFLIIIIQLNIAYYY